jgi:archaetidylinositol phosphate synthase
VVKLITKLRKQSKKLLTPIARALSRSGVSPNVITSIGLILSMIYALVIYLTRNPLVGVLIIVISSFMDALDGEVARVLGKASPLGAFLDSSFDRLEDTFFITPLVFFGFSPFLVSILIGLSLTISYLRAKAELVGYKMEGRGIIERGERIIAIVIILIALYLNKEISMILFYALIILSIVTVIQRFLVVIQSLKDKL